MESPRNHGGSDDEEYNSCESGWTMYIEDAFIGNDHSSIVFDDEHDDDDDDDDDSKVKEADDYGDTSDDGGDEESDDSMASDADSGPSNQLPKNINKHAATKDVSEKVYLQKHQHREKTLRNEGGEKSEVKARTRTSAAASHVQSRGKVNKTK